MRSNVNIRLVVFTFGVMMLLLRPFCVYQMTARNVQNDPGRALSLLQRLVKKKDDHHEEQSAVGMATVNNQAASRPERKLLVSLIAFLALLIKRTPVFSAPSFDLPLLSQRYRYRTVSCLLI